MQVCPETVRPAQALLTANNHMESEHNQNIKEKSGLLKGLLDNAEEYTRTSIELLKLKTLDVTSDFTSLLVSRLIVLIFLLIFVFMLTVGVALWLGDLLGKASYGFFIVAAFYGLIGVILYFPLGGYVKRRISDFIIKQILK
jgi:hypothetical protein